MLQESGKSFGFHRTGDLSDGQVDQWEVVLFLKLEKELQIHWTGRYSPSGRGSDRLRAVTCALPHYPPDNSSLSHLIVFSLIRPCLLFTILALSLRLFNFGIWKAFFFFFFSFEMECIGLGYYNGLVDFSIVGVCVRSTHVRVQKDIPRG